MKKNQVTLAGTNRLFTEALRIVLEQNDLFSVEINQGPEYEAVKKLTSAAETGIFVLCSSVPELSLIETFREAARRTRMIRVLFIVKEACGELLSFAGEKAGVGIMDEGSELDELIDALEAVSRGERYISKSVLSLAGAAAEGTPRPDPMADITPREREVLYWLSHGMTNVEIADRMILSEKTVKNHVSHLLKKLELTDRTKAAALAWSEGLSQISEEFFSLRGQAVLK